MRVLVHLSSAVAAFQPTAKQLAALSARTPGVELEPVSSDAELLAALPRADAVVAWRFPPEWYARAPRLRHVFTPAAGREGFAADPAGRAQRHFGRFHGELMAESLLAMVTFMNRRLGAALAAQRDRCWDRAPYSPTRRLRGQVVLIVGYGSIGQRCGQLLSGLGVTVHALRRDVTRPSPGAARVYGPAALFEALAVADHVVCVLPGDTGTDGLLGAPAFARMKPHACVYNLGRGGAIDVEALAAALSSGRIAGAFLDVVPEEPLAPSSPLWSTPGLYLTPHCSAIFSEYLDLYFEELAADLAALL